MTRTLVLYQPAQNAAKTALSGASIPCWERVGNVLGRRANSPKVILPGQVREILGFTLERMGEFVAPIVAAIENAPHAPYHRSTVWHWENSTRKHQIMPGSVCEAYRQIIRETVRLSSGGKYVAHVANVRLWRVTLRRVA